VLKRIERYHGCLLGLAVGDAVGTTLEFRPPGAFEPIEDMVGGGPFDLEPGQWTDDTSMALCLAESLIQKQGFDPIDQLERYVKWYRHGHLSSNGRCFDIGNTVRQALLRFERTQEPYSGSTDPASAGNGSLMRLAPVPLFFAQDTKKAIELSGESSRPTHGSATCVDACRYYGGLIVGTIESASKQELLSDHFCTIKGYWDQNPLVPEIAAIAGGSFKKRNPPDIRGTGYVVHSLEAALWAFYRSESFREGLLIAVNLGDDADTTGAIYGQLAGSYYGAKEIPAPWLSQLAQAGMIKSFAEKLYDLALKPKPAT
jgi:ADP-ribosyl-[dinitrogen reductase] hydrolase